MRGREREHAHFLPVDDATKCATTRKKKKKPQLQYYITPSQSDVSTLTPPTLPHNPMLQIIFTPEQ